MGSQRGCHGYTWRPGQEGTGLRDERVEQAPRSDVGAASAMALVAPVRARGRPAPRVPVGRGARGWPRSGAYAKRLCAALVVALSLPGTSPAVASGSVDRGPRDAPAIVFLHGWLMGPELWAHQLEHLCAEYRCHAVAQPGHGVPAPDAPLTMAAWSDRLHAELQAAGITRAVFVGHSMGGMLALAHAQRHPEAVLGLGLVGTRDDASPRAAPPPPARRAIDWTDAAAERAATSLIGPRFRGEHADWVAAWKQRVRGYDLGRLGNVIAAVGTREDLSAFTPGLSVPVSVIHCRGDVAVPFAAGEAMAARIPGAVLVTLGEDCGHAVPVEAPEAVTATVRALMGRVQR
jgi:pimeloyl-ACP methyl ester carboxylesterase